MIVYRKATLEDLETIWNRSIAENPEDPRYLRWKKEFIYRNQCNQAATFVVIVDNVPVGEVTLEYHQKGNRAILADGREFAYVQALRIRKEYEGKGLVSKLMQCMESYARNLGFCHLCIGVEAAETRNLGIYLHWGYNEFVMHEVEDDVLILFYKKRL